MLEIGSLVDGKYRVLSVIGRGGMSVVYMAINEKANKTWAIKEVRKDGVLDFETVKQGLIVETEMLKRLRHPNLPSIIDVIEDEKTFLIVMDYVEGNPLSKTLSEYGAQPQDMVIEWAKQLCDVLGYLHTRTPAIIYRDMKPSNIMLRPDGQVALIDFGTAREFKGKNLADTTCLGTVGYAAPEQFGGMGETDARTDIYGLGATMYHLITGNNPSQPPYQIQPIRQINPALSGGIENIILKCTQRDPNERYQSCAELMYALENYAVIDGKHKKKQKGRLALFSFSAFLTLVSFISGLSMYFTANKMANDTYENYIAMARTAKYDDKLDLYEKAVAIPGKAGQIDVYTSLIDLFEMYDDNGEVSEEISITKDEKEFLENFINENRSAMEDAGTYAEVSYQVGITYWLYDDYGDELASMKESWQWFQDAVDYADEDFKYLNLAKIYAGLADFAKNEETIFDKGAGEELGMFELFSKQLNELFDASEDETDIVKLRVYNLAKYMLYKYASSFKKDGVEESYLMALYDRLETGVENIDVIGVSETGMSGTVVALKSEIIKSLDDIKDEIELVYNTPEEEVESDS